MPSRGHGTYCMSRLAGGVISVNACTHDRMRECMSVDALQLFL